MKENAIIVDDELNVRLGLAAMIKEYCPNIEVVGQAASVQEGFDAIQALKPQIVFLDIKLPDGTGFDLLFKISNLNLKVIFITAFSEFALKAFKYSAIDYLLKPVIPDELINAVEKASKFIQQEKDLNEISSIISKKNGDNPQKIIIKTKTEAFYVDIDSIISCKADGNYCIFNILNAKPIMVAKTLKSYEEILVHHNFIRVHQSFLVNKKFVASFQNDMLKLTNGESIEVSRRKKSIIHKLLNS
jgi:two-component system LytT family response regulator